MALRRKRYGRVGRRRLAARRTRSSRKGAARRSQKRRSFKSARRRGRFLARKRWGRKTRSGGGTRSRLVRQFLGDSRPIHRKRLRKGSRARATLVAGKQPTNHYNIQSSGSIQPLTTTDYGHATILLTGSLWNRATMNNLNTLVQTDGGLTLDQKRQWAAIGYHDEVNFTPANAFSYRITQRGWRARYDNNIAVTTTFLAATSDTNAGDINIPGVSLFQAPLWVEQFKAVGKPVTKICGSSAASGMRIATFTNRSKKVKTWRASYPGRWAYATPRDTVFFTYEIVPERGFIAQRQIHLNTGVPTGSAWLPGNHIEVMTGSPPLMPTNHYMAPISMATSRTTRVEWLPLQQSLPIAYDSAPAAPTVPIGTSDDVLHYSLFKKGDDDNPHGAFDFLSGVA